MNSSQLELLGARGEMLALGEEYIAVIAAGAVLQVIGTGLVPFIRNHGGSFYAMFPNISLIIINRFSVSYGGEPAIATYACIAYVICIIYLILQGVGDGCQPLLSQCYGEKNWTDLKDTRKLAYGFAFALSIAGCVILHLTRGSLGALFGAPGEVNLEIARIMPIFLVSVPFVAILRITTASFYATEKSVYSYVLTFIEPLFMLVLMLILPPFFCGQRMIWWSTVWARVLSAVLALILKQRIDRQEMSACRSFDLPYPCLHWLNVFFCAGKILEKIL